MRTLFKAVVSFNELIRIVNYFLPMLVLFHLNLKPWSLSINPVIILVGVEKKRLKLHTVISWVYSYTKRIIECLSCLQYNVSRSSIRE